MYVPIVQIAKQRTIFWHSLVTGAFPVARYTYNFLSTDINNFLALISFLKCNKKSSHTNNNY